MPPLKLFISPVSTVHVERRTRKVNQLWVRLFALRLVLSRLFPHHKVERMLTRILQIRRLILKSVFLHGLLLEDFVCFTRLLPQRSHLLISLIRLQKQLITSSI